MFETGNRSRDNASANTATRLRVHLLRANFYFFAAVRADADAFFFIHPFNILVKINRLFALRALLAIYQLIAALKEEVIKFFGIHF